MREKNLYQGSKKIYFNLSELTSILFLICMNLNYLLGLSQLNYGGKSVVAEYFFAAAGIAFMVFHGISKRGYHYSIYEILFIMFALSIGVISFMKSGAMTFLKLILFWLGCRGIENRKLLKYEAWSLIISAGVVVATSLFGITSIRYQGNNALFSFGFKNPNNLPAVVTAILFSYCLSRDENITKKSIFFQILVVLLMYRSTGSRSATIVLLMFYTLLLFGCIPLVRRAFEGALYFLPYIFIFFAVASYFMGKAYNHSSINWLRINDVMSWRPYLWSQYVANNPLTLFGNRLKDMGTLDNAYLVLLLRYGGVVFGVYIVIFSIIAQSAFRKKKLLLGLAVICYDFYYLVEFTPILVNVNPLILIAFSSISTSEDRKEQEERYKSSS